ncbi:MAG: hypothetical protein IPM45_00420 [Acidimicrobiales bacterium]|nr:hypothetical protein [Acidimicrobiales bacterium]
MKKNRLAALGLVAGLLGGTAAGLAFGVPGLAGAQSTSSTTVEEQAPDADPGTRLSEVLAPLVADGTITQAQADAVIAALREAGPPPGHGDHGRGGPHAGLGTAATAIGITGDELRQALEAGQSIADVAQANGVDPQTVIDAMVAEAEAHLDEEVADGRHTQAEADERLAEITDRITRMVNGELPADGPGFGPGGPHRGGTDDDTTDGTTDGQPSATPSAITS